MVFLRRITLPCQSVDPADNGEYYVVIGTLQATLANNLSQDQIPMFPGIPAQKVRGKSFKIAINDLHLLDTDGKIKKTWHAEDWASALDQMVNGKPEPLLDNPDIGQGQTLNRIPPAMIDFYEKLLSNTGN